ncbi:hypothetical protein QAD02_007429 [Eretmocerus hayati]|uniref:Uncharacterized protein n=1 Tax=Eretmocerus hayati TaxID=131215 RepID=A0ACC2N3Y8_9HYME|nr:hypothetical protein QAD02_007429 [Eretmocerus hayati]
MQTSCALDASYESATRERAPQSSFLRHGPQLPEEDLSKLPHGPSHSDLEDDPNVDQLERSFGSLSTSARRTLASDDESAATYSQPAPAQSSSSSAYGSAEDKDSDSQPSASSNRLAQPRLQNGGGPSPTTHRQGRTRADRAARSAALARSVSASPAIIEVVDSVTDSDQSCSEDNTDMLFDVAVYRSLCAVFEATRHPFDGDALIRYVQDELTRGRERLRVKKYRDSKKKMLELQRQQEIEHTEILLDELAEEPEQVPVAS